MASDLAHKIADRLAVDVSEVEPVLDAAVDRIRQQVSNFGYARLSGLGTFRGRDGAISFEPDPVLVESANLRFSGLDRLDVDVAAVSQLTETIEPEAPALTNDQDEFEPAESLEEVEPVAGLEEVEPVADLEEVEPGESLEGVEPAASLLDVEPASESDDLDSPTERDAFDYSADRDEIEPLAYREENEPLADQNKFEPFAEQDEVEPFADADEFDSVADQEEYETVAGREESEPLALTGDLYGDEDLVTESEDAIPMTDPDEVEPVEAAGYEDSFADIHDEEPVADAYREDSIESPESDDEDAPTITWNSTRAEPAEPAFEDRDFAGADVETDDEPVFSDYTGDLPAESEASVSPEAAEIESDESAAPSPAGEETVSSETLEERAPVAHDREPVHERSGRRNMAAAVVVVLLLAVGAIVAYFAVSSMPEGTPSDHIVSADPQAIGNSDQAIGDQQDGDGTSTTDPDAGGPSGETQPPETTPDGAAPLADEAGEDDAAGAVTSSNDRTGDTATPASQDPLRASGGIDRAAGGYTIVVFSDRSQASAGEVAQRYQSNGYRAEALAFEEENGTHYRVAVGQFATLEEALAARDRLAGSEIPADAWLLRVH